MRHVDSLSSRLEGRVRKNLSLKNLVAFRIGGPAEIFVEPSSEEDIQKTVEFCGEQGLPLLTIGSGTNLLVRDGGVPGVVLYLGAGLPGEALVERETDTQVFLRVPAHIPKASLLDLALSKGWGGLEFSAGIPGTMGGAVYMNAGTKWGSYSTVIESVRLFVPGTGFVDRTNDEMKFKYRGHGESLNSEGAHGVAPAVCPHAPIIISVVLKLEKLRERQASRALADEILGYRGQKQPLELPNCGSVFKNPENSEKGAGRLIEACALKGLQIGDAMISTKHANFILNLGRATSIDVEALMLRIQQKVLEKTKIALEPEVVVVGVNA